MNPDLVETNLSGAGTPAAGGLPPPQAGGRLILTDGHIPTENADFVAPERFQRIPDAWTKRRLYSVKYQRLGQTGAEVTCVRLPQLPEALGGTPRSRVKRARDANAPRSRSNIERAAHRAKMKVRHLAKEIVADRMLTFTTRACITDRETIAGVWEKFNRLMCRATGDRYRYVVTMEYQKRGAIHLHAAVSGWFPVGLAHKLWQVALGGKGSEKGADTLGGVRVDRRGNSRHGRPATCKIARYISKYLVKEFGRADDFGKKRYWASKVALQPPVSFYCVADSANAAYLSFLEWCRQTDDPVSFYISTAWGHAFFLSPDGAVCWAEGSVLPHPPPF